MDMHELGTLVHQLRELLSELCELVVERCAGDAFLGVIYFHLDISTLQHYRQSIVLVKQNGAHSDRIHRTCKMELTVHHITRVKILQCRIFQHLEI